MRRPPRLQHGRPERLPLDLDLERRRTASSAASPTSSSTSPAPPGTREGNYLYYLCAREFAPQFDAFDFNFAVDRNIGIYRPRPAQGRDESVPARRGQGDGRPRRRRQGQEATSKDEKKETAARQGTWIDFDGLAARVARVPVPFDNYGGLSAAEGQLLYVRQPAERASAEPPSQPRAADLHLQGPQEPPRSPRGSPATPCPRTAAKVLVVQDGQFNVYDANPGGKDSKKTVSTGGLVVDRVPAEEWAEIFDEAWRRYRDFFYVENMHGYDWEALREQYEPLLAYVGHRSDLNYVIGEMIAELNVSHAYVAGGDYKLPAAAPRWPCPAPASSSTTTAGRYRIARIFAGQNEEDLYRSPLTEVGVDVHVGDYVLAIDGEELAAERQPLPPAAPQGGPARPPDRQRPADPRRLPGGHLPADRHREQPDLSRLGEPEPRAGGRSSAAAGVGYIHIPDMGEDGMREFIKWYYRPDPQGGAGRRRPRQRRRQRLADAPRAAAPQAAGAWTTRAPTTTRSLPAGRPSTAPWPA